MSKFNSQILFGTSDVIRKLLNPTLFFTIQKHRQKQLLIFLESQLLARWDRELSFLSIFDFFFFNFWYEGVSFKIGIIRSIKPDWIAFL